MDSSEVAVFTKNTLMKIMRKLTSVFWPLSG